MTPHHTNGTEDDPLEIDGTLLPPKASSDNHSSKVLHSSRYQIPPPRVIAAQGSYLTLADGRTIFEACGGPGVTCIGHGNAEVAEAVRAQMARLSYCFGLYFSNEPAEELARAVVATTGGALAKAATMSSGKSSHH